MNLSYSYSEFSFNNYDIYYIQFHDLFLIHLVLMLNNNSNYFVILNLNYLSLNEYKLIKFMEYNFQFQYY